MKYFKLSVSLPLFLCFILGACGEGKTMSYSEFGEIKSVVFYQTGNRQLSELVTCDLNQLSIKGSIDDESVLKKIFSSARPVKPIMIKYDPGMGVVNLKNGKQIRILTSSLENLFYVFYPEEQKGVFLIKEEEKDFFYFQKRILA